MVSVKSYFVVVKRVGFFWELWILHGNDGQRLSVEAILIIVITVTILLLTYYPLVRECHKLTVSLPTRLYMATKYKHCMIVFTMHF